MSHVPHDLSADFPESVEQIQELKLTDTHFARLAEEYHVLNRRVHRAETNIEPLDDFAVQELRKQRMLLKDEIASRLV